LEDMPAPRPFYQALGLQVTWEATTGPYLNPPKAAMASPWLAKTYTPQPDPHFRFHFFRPR